MRNLRLLIAGAAVVAAGVAVTVTALPASAQTADLALINSWNSGYQSEVTVTNDTSSTITSWRRPGVLGELALTTT